MVIVSPERSSAGNKTCPNVKWNERTEQTHGKSGWLELDLQTFPGAAALLRCSNGAYIDASSGEGCSGMLLTPEGMLLPWSPKSILSLEAGAALTSLFSLLCFGIPSLSSGPSLALTQAITVYEDAASCCCCVKHTCVLPPACVWNLSWEAQVLGEWEKRSPYPGDILWDLTDLPWWLLVESPHTHTSRRWPRLLWVFYRCVGLQGMSLGRGSRTLHLPMGKVLLGIKPDVSL